MPNHWESSARPLSVKTVYVNGSRHAILSPEDPAFHSGIFSLKKQSRPNSSMSISSLLSISSESQDSVSVPRVRSSKSENIRDRRKKDIASMLQGCLVKLELPSSNQRKVKETKDDINLNNSQEIKFGYDEGNLREERTKWVAEHCNQKDCRHLYERYSKENKLAEMRNDSTTCCYVYDCDNKGKKNYCFVKITSEKPSHIILNCSCEENWGTTHGFCVTKDCSTSDKNNYVISATIHNLIMGGDKNENLSDSCELPWDNCLTRTYNNPLSERVMQWLDLENKHKKRGEVSKTSSEDVISGNIERISAGRTFVDENNKSKYLEKNRRENKTLRKENVMSDEDVETEVKAEGNVETVLSMQKLDSNSFKERNYPIRCQKELSKEKVPLRNHVLEDNQTDEKPKLASIPTKIDGNSLMASFLKSSIANRFHFSMSAMDIQELLKKNGSKYGYSYQNKKKVLKEKRNCIVKESKLNELVEDINEVEKFKISPIKFLEKNKRNFENVNETTACQYERHSKECGKTIKNRNLNEEFEKYKKAIDNPIITRSRTVSQNLYPQQHKSPWPRDRKSIWLPEKDTNRPQLHIFIPPLPLKDPSDEGECESILGEVSY